MECRISTADRKMVFTAGHCGGNGDMVLNESGKQIGFISQNCLNSGAKVDLAMITLFRNIEVETNTLDDDFAPSSGVKLWTRLPHTDLVQGEWKQSGLKLKEMGTSSWVAGEILVAEALLKVNPGDSGAPIYSQENRLVGIVQGGNTKGRTNVSLFSSIGRGSEMHCI